MRHPIAVAIIDPDQMLCYLLSKALQPPEFAFSVAHDSESGIKMVLHTKPQIVILDIDLPSSSGFAVLSELQRLDTMPKIIMTSLMPAVRWRHYAREMGIGSILTKPYSLTNLIGAIKLELGYREHAG